jgi:hypothetical protein
MYEEPLERVSPGPQLPLDAVQSLAALSCESQLAFDLVERLGGEISPRLRIVGALELLADEAKRVLGLDHASGRLLGLFDQLRHTRNRVPFGRSAERVAAAVPGTRRRSQLTLSFTRSH